MRLTADTAPVWASYISGADAQGWIGGNSPVAAGSPLDLICQMACDWVQSFLDRPVTPTVFTRRFNTGAAAICLPYSPVVSITAVTEWFGSDAHTLGESTPQAQTDGWACDYATGVLTRTQGLYAKPWLPGTRNIEVTWTAGWAVVPPKVKIATLELAKYWWENTQLNSGVGVGTEVDVYGGTTDDTGLWTGVPHRIEAMLQPLTRVAIG